MREIFKNWLFNLIREYNYTPCNYKLAALPNKVEDDSLGVNPISFKLHSASNGKVIEFNHYFPDKDEFRRRLYIITNDQSIGEEINKILVIEGLRQ
jgi:hypothetical protein